LFLIIHFLFSLFKHETKRDQILKAVLNSMFFETGLDYLQIFFWSCLTSRRAKLFAIEAFFILKSVFELLKQTNNGRQQIFPVFTFLWEKAIFIKRSCFLHFISIRDVRVGNTIYLFFRVEPFIRLSFLSSRSHYINLSFVVGSKLQMKVSRSSLTN